MSNAAPLFCTLHCVSRRARFPRTSCPPSLRLVERLVAASTTSLPTLAPHMAVTFLATPTCLPTPPRGVVSPASS